MYHKKWNGSSWESGAISPKVVYWTILNDPTEVKTKILMYLYLVQDGFGQRDYAFCTEPSDTVFISGLQDSGEQKQVFEAEAYHLEGWCFNNGFKYKHVVKAYDLDKLWDSL